MEYIEIYKCLCERTRLRILNLLREGPLCVCHLHEILGEAQPNVSKQLGYLRAHGAVESERHNNWIMYRLPERRHPILEQNLKCLQDVAREDEIFRKDLAHRTTVVRRIARTKEGCPDAVVARGCC